MIGLLSSLGVARGGVAVAAFVGLVLACVLVGTLLLRRVPHGTRIAWVLAGLATLAALAVTLWPDTGSSRAGCTIGFTWRSPFQVQNLANIALLVPVAFFAALASRRPGPAAAAGAGLSAAVELVQAVVPALHRACDTQDWQLNTIGAVLGAAIGWWVAHLAAGPTPRPQIRGSGRAGRTVNHIWTAAAATAVTGWLVACALHPIPDGEIAFSEDPEPGPVETFGTGSDRWSIGIVPSGALTARDVEGAITRTEAVQGATP